jgi:hypothetical protein
MTMDDERPGDFGTAHIVHFRDDTFYFDASTWRVEGLDGSNPDDDGNVHYVVPPHVHLVIDKANHIFAAIKGGD